MDSDTPVFVTFRPLAPPDAAAARTLADATLGGAPFAAGMLAALDEAVTSHTDEYRAVGAHDGSSLVGFVVFGEIAGAIGAGRIYVVGVEAPARRHGIATALVEAACSELRSRGSRFAVIELLEEPSLASGLALAHRTGFREEGRVSEYVRDGVGLLLLRRDLAGA
jgi:ribosomal protein S18 acetylase RimI-like enzyme